MIAEWGDLLAESGDRGCRHAMGSFRARPESADLQSDRLRPPGYFYRTLLFFEISDFYRFCTPTLASPSPRHGISRFGDKEAIDVATSGSKVQISSTVAAM